MVQLELRLSKTDRCITTRHFLSQNSKVILKCYFKY